MVEEVLEQQGLEVMGELVIQGEREVLVGAGQAEE